MHRPGQLDVGQARSSSSKISRISSRARFAPRQKCSPMPKARCSLGVRPTSKRSASRKDLLVAVRRRVEDDDLVALADLLAAELGVARRGAAEVHDRRHPAQHLLDRGRQQRQVGEQARALLGVLDQRQHAAGDQVARGLVAGHGEQQEERVELHLGEPLAVDLAAHEHADQVVARMVARARGELVGVHAHLRGRAHPLLRSAVPRNSGSSKPIRRLLHSKTLWRSSSGTPSSSAMTCSGSSAATSVTKSHSPRAAMRVDDVPRHLADVRLEPRHDARREALADQPAVLAVRRRIHVEHDHPRLARAARRSTSKMLVPPR